MPVIMNCLDREHTTIVGGQHFKFKPNQTKYFYDVNIAHLIARDRGSEGLVQLPDELEFVGHLNDRPELINQQLTADQKAIIIEKRKEGVEKYCKELRALVYNAQISLRKDYDRMGLKADFRSEYTDADVTRIKELLKYQKNQDDSTFKRSEEIRDLEQKLEISKK